MAHRLEHKPSLMLSDEQNIALFALIGQKCHSISTAVVQLLVTSDSPAANMFGLLNWQIKATGVLCLIKDYGNRSYFMRIYDFDNQQLVWEMNLLNIFKYEENSIFLHTFSDYKNQVYGLNFTSKMEAQQYLIKAMETLSKRIRKRAGKPSGNISINNPNNSFRIIKMPQIFVEPNPQPQMTKSLKISAPFDFRHLQHVAFNPVTQRYENSQPDTALTASPYQISTNNSDLDLNAQNNCADADAQLDNRLIYENDEFTIYTENEIATFFNPNFVCKFGRMERISVKNVTLPPPPPLPKV